MSGHFADRAEAGRALARELLTYAGRPDTIILALPRGGVPIALELALALALPLDVLAVRKLGVPGEEELAFGAVASGGVRILDAEIVQVYSLDRQTIERVAAAEEHELRRRESLFRSGRPGLSLEGQTVILVDDGIATGSTMFAAIAAVRRLGAARVVVATAVAPHSTWRELRTRADEVVCLLTPQDFRAVSVFFESFPQLTDEDVRTLLERTTQLAKQAKGNSDSI